MASAQMGADAAVLERRGYLPGSQSYAPGQYGAGAFIVAVLLMLILVGFLAFAYMLIVKPPGTLTVTYELRGQAQSFEAVGGSDGPEATTNTKVCPR